MNISVVLINKETLVTDKAKVIASNISIPEFNELARDRGYTIKRKDKTLTEYYYVDSEGNVLVTYPSFHKLGSEVSFKAGKALL